MKETVIVTAPKSRRRAGYRFGPHPVEIVRTELTDAQLEALKSDPFLAVSVRPVEAAKVVAPAKKAASAAAETKTAEQATVKAEEGEGQTEGGDGAGEAEKNGEPANPTTGETAPSSKPGKTTKGSK
jgi:hypothetical protein